MAKSFLVQSNSNPRAIEPGETVILDDATAEQWVRSGYGRVEGDVIEETPPAEEKPEPKVVTKQPINPVPVVEDPTPKEVDE